MADEIAKLEARLQKRRKKEAQEAAKRIADEKRLRDAQKARKHAMAVKVGYAMLDEMDEKAAINSMVREILDRRLLVNRERQLFDLKPLADDKDAGNKSDAPKMTLVKDEAAA